MHMKLAILAKIQKQKYYRQYDKNIKYKTQKTGSKAPFFASFLLSFIEFILLIPNQSFTDFLDVWKDDWIFRDLRQLLQI